MQQIEAYTAQGVVSGTFDAAETLRESNGDEPIVVERATWYPIDGSVPERRARVVLATDDVYLVTTEAPSFSTHAVWHPISLEAGPFRVEGDLPAPPGFDPGRALTRPGGPFVEIRDARIELTGRPAAGLVERPHVLVNRYAVDRVNADLILGFFFPGARLETPQGAPAA